MYVMCAILFLPPSWDNLSVVGVWTMTLSNLEVNNRHISPKPKVFSFLMLIPLSQHIPFHKTVMQCKGVAAQQVGTSGWAGLGRALRAWAWLSSGLAFNFAGPSPEPKPYQAQAWLGLKPGLVDMFENIVSKRFNTTFNNHIGVISKPWPEAQGLGFLKSKPEPEPCISPVPGPGFSRLGLAWLGLAFGLEPSPVNH
ncbi:hypothetical protein ARMGADRAFT_1034422 [Armillaria gallica]|uniref:Uncharacterized protein n=1 Tax=Armillaria gallica TaxID=47427 RepID=A0A2H3CXR9_ARMGA|nr:hypothetical protein ARMGADRAFT_1034422 [Armillaria gallica]